MRKRTADRSALQLSRRSVGASVGARAVLSAGQLLLRTPTTRWVRSSRPVPGSDDRNLVADDVRRQQADDP